jgi:hypothetical protein
MSRNMKWFTALAALKMMVLGAALLSGLFLPFIIVYFVLSAISWIVLIGEML